MAKPPTTEAPGLPPIAEPTAAPASAEPPRPRVAEPEPKLKTADGSPFDPAAEEVRLVALAEKSSNMIEAVEEQAQLGDWVNIPPGLEHWHFFYAGQMGADETNARVADYQRQGWAISPKHPGNGLSPYMRGMEKVLGTSVILACPPAVYGRQRQRAQRLARERHELLNRRFGNEEKYRLRSEILDRAPRSEADVHVQFSRGTGDQVRADMSAMQRQLQQPG